MCKIMQIANIKIEDLDSVLGFKEKLSYSEEAKAKPLEKWVMEFDDGPIFKYIYRNFKPKRHLEFGTWLGIGTCICLEESEASVWTVNLPLGEFSDDDMKKNAYSITPEQDTFFRSWVDGMGLAFKPDSLPPSDSLAFCGMKYIQKKLGNRVCQIYCDSKKWDTSAIPEGFFDTVLIDGDHSMPGAVSDTLKAYDLLRPGGLMMWHDYCPPVRGKGMSVDGVADAIDSLRPWLDGRFEKLFWIEPSWILVGIKKSAPVMDNASFVDTEKDILKSMLIKASEEIYNLSFSLRKITEKLVNITESLVEYKNKFNMIDRRIKSLNPYLLFMIEKPGKIFEKLFGKK